MGMIKKKKVNANESMDKVSWSILRVIARGYEGELLIFGMHNIPSPFS